jgi:hypothetical protein
MLTSDHEVVDGQILTIVLTDGHESPVTFEFTSASYPPVQRAWQQFERELGERIHVERFFVLLAERFLRLKQAEQFAPSCATCGGPCPA